VQAQRRVEALKAKCNNPKLQFVASPMESVAERVGPGNRYDAVYIYEALHHAFNWRKAIDSCHTCLKPGGWLLLCHEPNLVHTFSSYRVAKIGNMHEIGFSRRELMRHLRLSGFAPIDYLTPRLHFWIKPHWICARKTP
jgi:2-polyprenyl-3-methyl-5-hydroxy-6-metoxy-1,4-benzoquinol methylase